MSTPPKTPCHSCKGTGIDPTVGFLDCEFCTPAPTPAGVSLSPPEQDLATERRVILQADRVMRVYIAGPMTGLPEFNFPAFNAMAEVLRADGWHVENPAEHGHVDGADWGDYLRYDISRLSTCSAMMLLPGWSSSRGARLEVSIAKELGHEILYAVGAEQMQTNFDRVTAERDALQLSLTAADEKNDALSTAYVRAGEREHDLRLRVGLLDGLLRRVVHASVLSFESGAPEQLESLEADICAALKPIEGGGKPCACPGCNSPGRENSPFCAAHRSAKSRTRGQDQLTADGLE
jgi:hypothetical protein